jgi:UDP-N-acetyl-D-mannosaminuronate dehydrogenase
VALATRGIEVIGVDINQSIVDAVSWAGFRSSSRISPLPSAVPSASVG